MASRSSVCWRPAVSAQPRSALRNPVGRRWSGSAPVLVRVHLSDLCSGVVGRCWSASVCQRSTKDLLASGPVPSTSRAVSDLRSRGVGGQQMSPRPKRSEPTVLVVTLRANAHGLLAGAPVGAIRRRLKQASLLYDRVLLEAGTLRVDAGPGGSASFWSLPRDSAWQTAMERRRATDAPFTVSVAAGSGPRVAASGPYQPVVSSPTSVSWVATLEPFARELPRNCGWIEYFEAPPMGPDLEALCSRWSRLDRQNPSLRRDIDVRFVRSQVIKGLNHDLALAVGAGAAMTADSLHSRVLDCRLQDETGWSQQGFALPLLVPRVGHLGWDELATLRRDRAIDRWRQVHRELEMEALAVVADGGDLERAVRNVYERRLRDANAGVEGLGGVVIDAGASLVLGGAGAAVQAVVGGPLGVGLGLVGPVVIDGALTAKRVLGRRAARRWLAFDARLGRL